MSSVVASRPGHVLPDLPNRVHGIKRAGAVWAVQCDDCLTLFTGPHLVIVASYATFNAYFPGVRLCDSCWPARK